MIGGPTTLTLPVPDSVAELDHCEISEIGVVLRRYHSTLEEPRYCKSRCRTRHVSTHARPVTDMSQLSRMTLCMDRNPEDVESKCRLQIAVLCAVFQYTTTARANSISPDL